MNKDREINEFLEKFDSEKQKEEVDIEQLQDKVEQTLEELARVCDLIENIPDEKKVKEMNTELKFKKEKTDETMFTLEKLKIYKEKLNKEMTKYQHIDSRLVHEIEGSQVRLAQMNDEIANKFSRVDEIKSTLEDSNARLKLKKDFLTKKRE